MRSKILLSRMIIIINVLCNQRIIIAHCNKKTRITSLTNIKYAQQSHLSLESANNHCKGDERKREKMQGPEKKKVE